MTILPSFTHPHILPKSRKQKKIFWRMLVTKRISSLFSTDEKEYTGLEQHEGE